MIFVLRRRQQAPANRGKSFVVTGRRGNWSDRNRNKGKNRNFSGEPATGSAEVNKSDKQLYSTISDALAPRSKFPSKKSVSQNLAEADIHRITPSGDAVQAKSKARQVTG
jgi:hypothetical protein